MMMPQRLPPLRLFAVFEAVLRSGSPQRAAAELNVSQPAISQAIKALETHIGAALLDRSTRPPTLTEAGRILQRAVTEGLGRITEAIAQIDALQRVSPGSVTVACSVGTATYWLMPRLSAIVVEGGFGARGRRREQHSRQRRPRQHRLILPDLVGGDGFEPPTLSV